MRKALCTGVLLAVPRAAFACPVCFGQSDSPLANATNMGIIAMLGVVAMVLSAFGAFIVHLNRRGRLVASGGIRSVAAGRTQLSTSTPQEGTAQC